MVKKCSNCGKEIDKTNYYKCLDNYLQVKFFDNDENNCFCSLQCIIEYMSIENIINKKEK